MKLSVCVGYPWIAARDRVLSVRKVGRSGWLFWVTC